MLITFLDLSFLTWSTNHKDLLFVFRHQKAYSQYWRSYMFQKGHIFLLPCLYHRLVDFNCQMILWNLLLIVLKDPVRTMQNFVFFYNKKSVNRKPFLVRTILFFKYQNFLRCVKTSKMPLRKFLRPTIFFVRRQNLLFLHSYPSSGHLISRTWLDVFRYMKTFAYFWCEQGYRNEKIGNDKKNYAIFLQTPNSIFCCVAGCKENRCYSLKMASLGSMY